MRRMLALLLAFAFLLSFSACVEAPSKPGPQDEIAEDDQGYFASAPTSTAYSGEELVVELSDIKYGGSQFVSKLFTEGLGRGPSANEYKYYIGLIETSGCTAETLLEVTRQFFSSRAFTGLKLAPEYEVMAVYRAVLNRDPTLAEAKAYAKQVKKKKAVGVATELVMGEEFAALLPEIVKGPYYWGVNNAEYSPSGNIITSKELQQMIRNTEGKTVELEPGTLVLMTTSINLTMGKTLTTKGNPTHYTMQARILRVDNNASVMVKLQGLSTLTNIWVDGNRGAFQGEELIAGTNVIMDGNDAKVTYCRINGSTSGTHLVGSDLRTGLYMGYNLVTCYETIHEKSWTDGITHAGTDSIIEHNTVIDATDVGIIVFRFISTNHDVPQTTVVRNNTVLNLGNSAYAGLDIDTWHSQGATQLFTGTLFENNVLWTSFRAHQHFCLSLAPLAWTSSIGDRGIGTTMINNYTPEGLQVLCAAAIAVDGVTDVIVRGNHLNVYIGPWGRGYSSALLKERLVSVNEETSSGDIQGTWENMVTWQPGLSFMNPRSPQKKVRLKHAVVHEDRVTAQAVGHPGTTEE